MALILWLASAAFAGVGAGFLCLQDNPNPPGRAGGCSAQPCEKDKAKRAAQDEERQRRLKAGERLRSPYPGLKVRTSLTTSKGEENDCREFVLEGCYWESAAVEKPFKYEYVLSGRGKDWVWTLQGLEGMSWEKPHRFRFNPHAKQDQNGRWVDRWVFDEKAAGGKGERIHCPIDKLDRFGGDGWMGLIFDAGATKMTVTSLEHVLKEKD